MSRVQKECEICKNKFEVSLCRKNSAKVCSKKCFGKFIGLKKIHLGKPHSKDARLKMSLAKKKNPTKYWLGKKRDEKTLLAMKATQFKKGVKPKYTFPKGHLPSHTGKKRPELAGENSPFWKGGITPINEKIRKSLEYKLWRTAVFERDNYICVWCKERGKKLNADHIKPFSLFPELRFAIDNGRTLCIPCHRKTDTFGGKITKYASH